VDASVQHFLAEGSYFHHRPRLQHNVPRPHGQPVEEGRSRATAGSSALFLAIATVEFELAIKIRMTLLKPPSAFTIKRNGGKF
jgi:hypothetical protein